MILQITPAEWNDLNSVNGNPTATASIFELIAEPSNTAFIVDGAGNRTHRIFIQDGHLVRLPLAQE